MTIRKEHRPRLKTRYARPSGPQSINGWTVLNSPDWSDRRLKAGKVPGTRGKVEITAHKDVLPLFLNIAGEYHKFSKLRAAEGYDAKVAQASPSSWSDHYSGTAMDFNAPYEGALGMGNYKWWQKSERRAFVETMLTTYPVLMWGGSVDFGGSYTNGDDVDWMHWALKPGTTLSEVQTLISYLQISKNGYRVGHTGPL